MSPRDSTGMITYQVKCQLSGSTGLTDTLLFLDLCEADLGQGLASLVPTWVTQGIVVHRCQVNTGRGNQGSKARYGNPGIDLEGVWGSLRRAGQVLRESLRSLHEF